MHRRLRVIAVAMLATLPSIAAAQSDSARVTSNENASASSVPSAGAGPRIDATAAAFRMPGVAVADSSAAALLQRRSSRDVSRPVAIMIVGGAAIVLGSVVGNDVGDLIVIGGVVAVLYGLYEYLK